MSLFPSSFISSTVSLPSCPSTSLFTLHHKATNRSPTNPPKLLLLLHGYPQTHTLWWDVIRTFESQGLLQEWDVLIPDLPGYGSSRKIHSSDGTHLEHSKRFVALDILHLVDHFYTSGTQKFVCVGHDRGARVGYRMARDHPERVLGLCVQDIVPTVRVFEKMSLEHGHVETFRSYHWIFLALPSPLPETLINSNPSFYISHTLNSWTGSTIGSLAGGEKRAWDSWVGAYGDEKVVEGALEDYRAGATIDLVHDAEDEGVLDCPILVLYSVHLAKRFEVGAVWEKLGERVEEHKVGDEGTGHFLPVEATEQTCEYMLEWMKKGGW